MSDRFTLPDVADLRVLQPGVLGIKPVVTEGMSGRLPNAAVQKVAEDVLAAARLSLTSVVAEPDARVRDGSAESALASVARQLPMAKEAAVRAKALLAADTAAKEVSFGRFADKPADLARESGFARIVEDERPIALDLKAFGIVEPHLTVPVGALTRNAAGGFEVAAGTPALAGFEEALQARGMDFEAAVRSARGDFEDALRQGDVEALVDRDRFAAQWGQLSKYDPFAAGSAHEDFEAQQAVTDKLRLWVRTVRCNDETNPEWPGNDEIALAGVSIDEDGDTKPIAERFVGSGFSDGTTRSPNWDYHWFSLGERNYWPKRFGVTLIMAEKDNGGLSSFMQKLWDQVKNSVHNALTAAAQKAGVALGAFLGVPQFGPLIGSAMAAAANWIVDKVADWLINLFKDDIFRPYTAWATIPSMSARWHFPNGTWGNTWGPLQTVTYTGFGGQYALTYQWQLYS